MIIIFCLPVHPCTSCVPGDCGVQKRVLAPLELELNLGLLTTEPFLQTLLYDIILVSQQVVVFVPKNTEERIQRGLSDYPEDSN